MSAADRCTHYVADAVYGSALAARRGSCTAVCGHHVIMCALVSAPGPLCVLCTTTHEMH